MNAKQKNAFLITDPPFAQALLEKISWAQLWLIARMYVGWEWLIAGWWGLDRWPLPALGTPWQPDWVF